VPVNALVHATDPAEAAAEAVRARRLGFTAVKIKVGARPAIDTGRLEAVRTALGTDIRLRIDANGCWSTEEAVRQIRAWEHLDLELVEQPVPARDLHGLAAVRSQVRVPVAADEVVTDADAARAVIDAGAADVLVIKPMVVGGVGAAVDIARLAHEAGLEAILTTTIDTGVATAAALHAAAAVGTGRFAHGLATAAMLHSDLVTRSLPVEGGCMHLPRGPGLGVELDEQALERYRVSPRR
jgi:L-alanine-DL-glutamate epimerase-like enolase superfamily enzyme